MNKFPRNPKPDRGDIIEITENILGRKSKYLKVGEQFKVRNAYDNSPIFNPTKEIHIYAKNKDGGICNIRERNYSWKIVKKCDENLALTNDEKEYLLNMFMEVVETKGDIYIEKLKIGCFASLARDLELKGEWYYPTAEEIREYLYKTMKNFFQSEDEIISRYRKEKHENME